MIRLFKKKKLPTILRFRVGLQSGPAITNGKTIYRESSIIPTVGSSIEIEKNFGVVLWVRYMFDGDFMYANEMIEIGVGCEHYVD